MSDATSNRQNLLSAALAYARRGWHVFPLQPGRKRPALRTDWEGRATTDPDRIHACWEHDAYNIGIACGPSRLIVVDLDTPKGLDDGPPPEWSMPGITDGADVLAELAARAGERLPVDTFSVRTGRGGQHLYFTAPAGLDLGNSAGRLGWLIDTRGRGGYIVAAGSVVDARPYTVVHDGPVGNLPEWIADRLRPSVPTGRPGNAARLLAQLDGRHASGYVLAALRAEVQRVLDSAPHTHNVTLNEAAFALGQLVADGMLPHDLVVEALQVAGEAVGQPPREAAGTIRSGLAAGTRKPRHPAAGDIRRAVPA
ncbi:bifunctional DNA primase/polymerase [Actinopolymorpha sp. B9G3]|uniref:bifunctional DNA primase/polymerase n=1 Tax=Actinopolymorpha sp. B9G3 TaxID=3158970 RepID=UPI0032D8DBAE